VDQATKASLYKELLRVGRECLTFGYSPGRFFADLANSEPDDLCVRYTLGPPTEGFVRLTDESRLDLAVENVVWRFREHFPAEVAEAARRRLDALGFDVLRQQYRPSS
jgi:hypothetical protein